MLFTKSNNQACHRWRRAALLLVIVLGSAAARVGWAAPLAPSAPVVQQRAGGPVTAAAPADRVLRMSGIVAPAALATALQQRLDATGTLTADQIDRLGDDAFTPYSGQPLALSQGALWYRFDAVAVGPAEHWRLALPLPTLDEATLYHRDGGGVWQQEQAGDTRPMSVWSLPGRYPVFSLPGEVGVTVRYYLQIRHARVPYSLVPAVINENTLIGLQQNEHMLLGIYFGLAMLAVALATVHALAYRDAGFAAYALHVALLSGAQGITTGIAGLYWWPNQPQLNNTGALMLLCLSAASGLLFVRTVGQPHRLSRGLDVAMKLLMVALPVCGVVNALLLSTQAFVVYSLLLTVSVAVLTAAVALVSWRRDSQLRWLSLGFAPVALSAVFPLLRNFGVVGAGFLPQYALMLGSALASPVLFYGLHQRLTRRILPSARAKSLQTIDPLTGLHSAGVLATKLEQAIEAAGRRQQPFALLMVHLANQAMLQAAHGREVGERAMVMAASRIRAVARPTDVVARAGDTQIALLIHGPVTAASANEYATKILASGLRPSDELPAAEALQFHIAVGHVDAAEPPPLVDAASLLQRMRRAVHDMNDGSRKAIRRVRL